MKLQKFSYFSGKEKKTINLKKVSLFSFGLMFKKRSPPLLFDLGKEKYFSITSIFCKPFRVILLDKNKKKIKSFEVLRPKFKIVCYGCYLIEVPLTNITATKNRKI